MPRWDCACDACVAVRAHAIRRRTHASVAVSADGETWLLVGASPDVLRQIGSFDGLFPQPGAPPPLVAVAVASADLADAGGLGALGGAALTVFAPAADAARVAAIAPTSAAVVASSDEGAKVTSGDVDCGLVVSFAPQTGARAAVIVHEPGSDRVLVWAPDLGAGSELPAAAARAACVFADASAAPRLDATTQRHRYLVGVAHDSALLAGDAPQPGWSLAADGLDLFV